MLFATATGYALRALAALPEDGSFSLSRVLAERTRIPAPYLAKILQELVQGGLLESVRGPRGGFRLTRPAHHITVGEVVAVLQGPDALSGCVMGFGTCSDTHPCPMHEAWSAVKAQVSASMAQATIRDLQLMGLRQPKTANRARRGPAARPRSKAS